MKSQFLKKENYHRETYRNIFDMFDSDMDGFLDETDLLLVFTQLGKTEATTNDIADLLAQLNSKSTEKHAGMTFDQFVELVHENTEEEDRGRRLLSFLTKKTKKTIAGNHTEGELKEAFNMFDENGDGFVSKAEFKNVVEKLQNIGAASPQSNPSPMAMSDSEIDYLFSIVDLSGKGYLSFDQFVSLFTKTLV